MTQMIPVIAIDGPSGSGKGTISQLLAKKLNWHLLDSGALYRILAFKAHQQEISLDDIPRIVQLVPDLVIEFVADNPDEPARVRLNQQEVTEQVRAEETGKMASKIAAFPAVRKALLDLQRSFRCTPGLIADGRDMGTVVFKDALLKVFMTASVEERAGRRRQQLLAQQFDVKLATLVEELAARDARDRERIASPMKPADDAIIVDTTDLDINAVMDRIWQLVQSALHRE